MSERSRLLASIAATIGDYRADQVAVGTPDHVDTWVRQFSAAVRMPLLRELDHVLRNTYVSRQRVLGFLGEVVHTEALTGGDPAAFWRHTRFLDIQAGGSSQTEVLAMLDQVLHQECRLREAQCGTRPQHFAYLDDCIFSGNRVLHDLTPWIESTAPADADLHVIVMVVHRGGHWYASSRLEKVAQGVGKKIHISWWHMVAVEDRKSHTNTSGVLRPAYVPSDARSAQYVQMLTDAGYPPSLRLAGRANPGSAFSSEEGRDLLEQEFLKAGLRIREMCPNLPETMRPLGYSVLKTLGFGSLYVTFRNCPNTCPLAFWVGDPWYPLFPRKIN